VNRRFVSFDRHTVCDAEYDQPDRYRELFALPRRGPLIAQGAGISYVAASFGEGVKTVGMRRFNRILAFNADERWVEVEAGITLGKLHDFCRPHGLTLPVQPGHPQITVGGCIAGNVHGKNQYRDGLFGDHVSAIRLFHPAHGELELSPELNRELFQLTLGGLGLTGVVTSARLMLTAATSPYMLVEHVPVETLDEAFDAIAERRQATELLYAWLDLANLARPGRGYVIVGSPAEGSGADDTPLRFTEMDAARRRFRPPLLTRATLPAINRVYRLLGTRHTGPRRQARASVLFPALGREMYFDGYGDRGFLELQALVPDAAAKEYGARVIGLIRKHARPVGLATLKAFRGAQRFLDYNGSGYSLTIDVVNHPTSAALLADVDELNCEVGAITAVLKDSRLRAPVARRQYPEYDAFRHRLHGFDPERLFASALSRRLEL
jgi:decaprenylphospho-beta-D-ribofuranose 2-oxidase